MRCKICDIPHKNTGRHELWIEQRICRICAQILDLFSWNGNYLQECWRTLN